MEGLASGLVWFFRPEPLWYHEGGRGFAIFGPEHLTCLAACAGLVATLLWRYRRGGGSRERLAQERAMAGTAVGLVVSKDLVYVAQGLFEPLFWPLHICNLCEFVALAYAVAPRSAVGGRMGDLLFCWGLTGGLGALLFPGWSYYTPAFAYASLCGFAEHALIFACALCPLTTGDLVPRPRRMWFPLVASVACGALFLWLNPLLGTNFFFVTNPASAGAPLAALVGALGHAGFLVAYLAGAVGSWAASYGIWWLARGRKATVCEGDGGHRH